MKLSIIIPCFNVSLYIKKCLDSIIQQENFKEIEVLVIDDGSNDNLAKKINDYLNKFKNIKYLYKKNSGLSDTRNFGLINAKGEYIMFLDGDDYLEKEFYKDIRKVLDKKIDILNFGHRQVNSQYKLIKDYYIDKEALSYKDFIYNSFLTSACTKVIKRNFILKNSIYFLKGIWYEDVNFVLKLVVKSQNNYNIPKVYYNYFQREKSITKTYNDKILDIFICLDNLFEYFYLNNIKLSNFEQKNLIIEYSQVHHYSRLIRLGKDEREKNYKKTIFYWKKYGVNNICLEKILYIDCMYLKGILGRVYFKIISKGRGLWGRILTIL